MYYEVHDVANKVHTKTLRLLILMVGAFLIMSCVQAAVFV